MATEHDQPPDEWDFLTFDPDETCSVCGDPIRPAQAVAYQHGSLSHAKCWPGSGSRAA
jgi:hypothetical protein